MRWKRQEQHHALHPATSGLDAPRSGQGVGKEGRMMDTHHGACMVCVGG